MVLSTDQKVANKSRDVSRHRAFVLPGSEVKTQSNAPTKMKPEMKDQSSQIMFDKLKMTEDVSRNNSHLDTNNCSEYLINTNRRHSAKDCNSKVEHKTASNFY